jgi:hypothetical protein
MHPDKQNAVAVYKVEGTNLRAAFIVYHDAVSFTVTQCPAGILLHDYHCNEKKENKEEERLQQDWMSTNKLL